jgi:glycosyltransferase involved in cell wall biosynthesis
MGIAIEPRYVAPGGSGIQRYARNLIRAYLEREDAHEIFAMDRGAVYQLSAKDLPESVDAPEAPRPTPRQRLVLQTKKTLIHPLFRNPTFFAAYSWLAHKKFQRAYHSAHITLLHALNYMPPGRLETPTIPVVYDCSHIRYAETHPAARLKDMERLPRFVEDAPIVHTISEFSKREIMDLFGLPAERIGVVIPGISDTFTSAPVSREETLQRLDLTDGKFFLCVGTLEPRKNLRTVLDAHRALPQALRQQVPLVLVGAAGWGNAAQWALSHSEASLGLVRSTGYLSDEAVRDLYSACRAFLFPSLYEGYGLPVREALAAGAPTAISEAEVLDEAADGHATILPTRDVDAWARYLAHSIEVAPPRTPLAPPTWRDAAGQLADLYLKAAG